MYRSTCIYRGTHTNIQRYSYQYTEVVIPIYRVSYVNIQSYTYECKVSEASKVTQDEILFIFTYCAYQSWEILHARYNIAITSCAIPFVYPKWTYPTAVMVRKVDLFGREVVKEVGSWATSWLLAIPTLATSNSCFCLNT